MKIRAWSVYLARKLGRHRPARARGAQELQRAKLLNSDLVVHLAHELRTSINVIRGYADLAIDGEFGEVNPDLSETLRRIEERAATLQHLIDSALELARLETSGFLSRPENVALSDLIAEVEAETSADRQGSKLAFEWRVEDDIAGIRSDVAKLKLVLRNLISNAFKFTPQGSVVVEIRHRAGGVEFAVRDTGIGIRPDQRETIFEPFRQADVASKRSFASTGLGLHICRRALEMMGGSIRVDSEIGHGSVFRVWIPAQVIPSGGRGEGKRPSA